MHSFDGTGSASTGFKTSWVVSAKLRLSVDFNSIIDTGIMSNPPVVAGVLSAGELNLIMCCVHCRNDSRRNICERHGFWF